MTILYGGNFSLGGMQNELGMGNALTETSGFRFLNSHARLVPCPLRKYGQVLECYTSHADYTANPSYDGAIRSEVFSYNSNSVAALNKQSWGNAYWYAFRFIVPPFWGMVSGEADRPVIQLHDIVTDPTPRRPVFDGAITEDNVFECKLSFEGNDSGLLIHSMSIEPLQEVDVVVFAHWADGYHEPNVNGHFSLFVNGILEYNSTGHNHWAGSLTYPRIAPPYLKAGIYCPDKTGPSWVGKHASMYHVGVSMGDSSENLITMQRSILN